MTRSELVDLLAERSRQLTRRDAEAVVTIVLGAMGDALARGNRVEIRGFGSFAINRRPARIGHNPRTGQPIQISELRVPHFKPGKELREAVARLARTDPDEKRP
jgi:integration host factor subunit beta